MLLSCWVVMGRAGWERYVVNSNSSKNKGFGTYHAGREKKERWLTDISPPPSLSSVLRKIPRRDCVAD